MGSTKMSKILKLQMEAVGEIEYRSGGRQGGGDVERVHAMSQNDGKSYSGGAGGATIRNTSYAGSA